ncbi:uncharacterized protein BDR25DRAFT_270343 [Lindgomyces ingoldianus]|uniref:Uncharacterized protein n=1 Tax=Lindgomyces ingoldianus TaxID=673940 RepID=A0ACB6QF94_9PLEO|nr:uncharacterized protein BDR25DRAFT_270343 [Lindgomyces ingoldianus]KAF2465633.1 hypothetical protein BDR25DRAFT_270343 [Lindgomyces ingoldianus]
MANHPKHPATVHFPITFITLTGALDVLYLASTHPTTAGLVASASKTLDVQLSPSMIPQLSYYTTLLTLITAVPAVLSGAIELMPLIKRNGFGSRKAQIGVLHAMLNDVGVFGSAYNWWTRRTVVGFEPSGTNVLISSVLALPTCLFAAYLGGALVYTYGMGVGRGRNKVKKAQ